MSITTLKSTLLMLNNANNNNNYKFNKKQDNLFKNFNLR